MSDNKLKELVFSFICAKVPVGELNSVDISLGDLGLRAIVISLNFEPLWILKKVIKNKYEFNTTVPRKECKILNASN
jgi:hypothetical protein